MRRIVAECLKLDELAHRAYLTLAERAEDVGIRPFWKRMAAEEEGHVRFWQRLLELTDRDAVPMIFDNPEHLADELAETNRKAHILCGELGTTVPTIDALVLSFRIEFFLLHPVLIRLFEFMHPVVPGAPIGDAYEGHLNRFVDSFNQSSHEHPYLGLLGETLVTLWHRDRELSHQATTDALTGVLNRRAFFDRVLPMAYLAQRNNLAMGVLMTDIDDFKKANDTYGHQVGDTVLRHVGTILLHRTRASDLVARYGGEEFIVCFSGGDPADIRGIGMSIQEALRTQQLPPGFPRITLSMGVAQQQLLSVSVQEDLAELIRLADSRLLRAKREGKNRIISE